MSFQSPWPDIGDDLDTKYKSRIFYHQGWSESHNFLELLVPPSGEETKFFGTHVLNLFIAQKVYGWKKCLENPSNHYHFSWPPDGWTDTLNRYLSCKDRFASYKTLIWVDTWSATIMQSDNPETEWLSMMSQTDTAIQSFCSSTDGFEYMGKIDSQVESDFFKSYIDSYYGNQPYWK